MSRIFLAIALLSGLVVPAIAGEPVAQTFAAPPEKVWSVTQSVLKQQGWEVEKSDQANGWINTESRSVNGEDYGVYAKGARHRLVIRLKAAGANRTTVSVERALFNRERILWIDKDEVLTTTDQSVEKNVLAAIGAVPTVSGPSEAAARAVSACAALAAVGAPAWLGAHLLGPRGGLVAGVALLTGIGFFAYGRYVRPETLFVAALAGGFALCLVGIRDGRRGLCAAGLALFGCAALAKDPLGALLPPLAIGVALALAGRARPFSAWLPGTGVAACLIIGFGWWVGAELRTPGFGWYTTIDNHVLNVARARHFADEDVPLTAVEFLAVAIGSALPWVIAAAVAVWSLARRRAWRGPAGIGWVALAILVLGVLGVPAPSPFRLP